MTNLDLSNEQFNQIRRKEDYPKLYNLFMSELPQFENWMADQQLNQNIIFEHGLARFIISDVMLYLCQHQREQLLWDDGTMDFRRRKEIGLIDDYTIYCPYFLWFKRKVDEIEYTKIRNSFCINFYTQGHHFFMGKVKMRNISSSNIASHLSMTGKLLDFVSLDNITIINPHNNQSLHIYCSSAINLRFIGGVAFLKFAECKLSSHNNNGGLTLENGPYQQISFRRCSINLQLCSVNITRMMVVNCNFKVKCDFVRLDSMCKFDCSNNEIYSYSRGKSSFYTEVVNLYVAANDYAGAGFYYYKKRKALMLESLLSWKNFQSDKFGMTKKEKSIFNIRAFLRGVTDIFNFLCWGFGERPTRTLIVSAFVILLFSCVYYFSEKSSTQTVVESLYFIIISFKTLGF